MHFSAALLWSGELQNFFLLLCNGLLMSLLGKTSFSAGGLSGAPSYLSWATVWGDAGRGFIFWGGGGRRDGGYRAAEGSSSLPLPPLAPNLVPESLSPPVGVRGSSAWVTSGCKWGKRERGHFGLGALGGWVSVPRTTGRLGAAWKGGGGGGDAAAVGPGDGERSSAASAVGKAVRKVFGQSSPSSGSRRGAGVAEQGEGGPRWGSGHLKMQHHPPTPGKFPVGGGEGGRKAGSRAL